MPRPTNTGFTNYRIVYNTSTAATSNGSLNPWPVHANQSESEYDEYDEYEHDYEDEDEDFDIDTRQGGSDMPVEGLTISLLHPDNAQYGAAISQAFNFMRLNASRRYSDSTLMKLARANDNIMHLQSLGRSARATANAREQQIVQSLPSLVVAQQDFRYDEETEVKHGGIVGLLAAWRGERKAILAVSRNLRRQGIGRQLLYEARYSIGEDLGFWVGRGNVEGQHFLLANGMFPTAINSQGAIRYSVQEEMDG